MQMVKKNIVAISGSIRQHSSNERLIKAIQLLTKERFNISLFKDIAALPHFNPDDNNENAPPTVMNFRRQINTTDGVIICTPEYAHGVPGTLKNAIDWTVSTNEFYHKPTVLITASTDGRYGHQALLETLKVMECKDIDALQLVIQFVRTKISVENSITDEITLADISALLDRFFQILQRNVTITKQ